eukprot:895463-Lingulodinium_polyedra.AAC.1
MAAPMPHATHGLVLVRDIAGGDITSVFNEAIGEILALAGKPALTFSADGFGVLRRVGRPDVL